MTTPLRKCLGRYADDVRRHAAASTASEASYYPALDALFTGVLTSLSLPFEVRTNPLERREGGGRDLPDLAFYDGAGFPVVLVEAKLPGVELEELAVSVERDDQIGRYLASTGAVLLTNVRAFGLLTTKPGPRGRGRVAPADRVLEETVEFWPSERALRQGKPADLGVADKLGELLDIAATRYAPISQPQSLAKILARLARRAKADLPVSLQSVQPLLDDFAEALGLHFAGDEGQEFLRSSLIQTAFYGVFAAWCLWHRAGGSREFRWQDTAEYLRIPFLGSLFYEFANPTRLKEMRLAAHLDAATGALGRVEREGFFSRFRLRGLLEPTKPGEDIATAAITYFYEPFLEAFDPDLRKDLGVWYTPPEIVRYQVRRIDALLKTELGLSRGFADDSVVVLDPCCGTGAYLIEVLRIIAERLVSEGAGAMLGAKLVDALHRRVVGFEILTAPFVVAQLQLYLLLAEMGAEPRDVERPAVFLTNALTGWDGPEQVKLNFPELQEEHDAASRIKRDAKIIVILGNPPYNRFAGVPLDEEADLADYYKGIVRDDRGAQVGQTKLFREWGVRKHLLDDLYLRFFRLAEKRIGERAEHGIVSFISNSSWLSGRSHPIMRKSLLHSFDLVYVDDLHGNRIASERTPTGESCETIFHVADGGPGIKVGTAIATLVRQKRSRTGAPATVRYRSFWGRAAAKRHALLRALEMDAWPVAQRHEAALWSEGPRSYDTVVPSAESTWKLTPVTFAAGYEEWPALDELFPVTFQGVNPNRGLEGSLVDTDPAALGQRMQDYFSDMPFEELATVHPVLCEKRARYTPREVREALRRKSGFDGERIVPYVTFPLDQRWLYYETEGKLLNERRPEFWANLEENSFLVAVPQPRRISEARPLFATCLVDLHLHDRGSVCFPVSTLPNDKSGSLFSERADDPHAPRANLASQVWRALSKAWNLSGDRSSQAARDTVLELFRCALTLLHSPQYASDHASGLAADWARLPIPRNRLSFDAMVVVGERLATLLNPLAPADQIITGLVLNRGTLGVIADRDGRQVSTDDFKITIAHYGAARGGWRERDLREGEADHQSWGNRTGDLYLNDRVLLSHVPERVWTYELGGYPVIKKWLGYREAKRRGGSPLTLDEIEHLRSIVHRIAAILSLSDDLDALYAEAAADAFTVEELGLATGAD